MWFWCKKNHNQFTRTKSSELSCMGCNARMLILSEIQAKVDQHCRAENCMLCQRYGIICHRSSLIRLSYHFSTHFNLVAAPLVNILNTNTELVADIHHWNVWTVDNKLCKVWFIISGYSMHNCMFTLKVNFKV